MLRGGVRVVDLDKMILDDVREAAGHNRRPRLHRIVEDHLAFVLGQGGGPPKLGAANKTEKSVKPEFSD